MLQWMDGLFWKGLPFKFNQAWLDDWEFYSLVHDTWKKLLNMGNCSTMSQIMEKLRILKREVHICEKKKKQQMLVDLLAIEDEISRIHYLS